MRRAHASDHDAAVARRLDLLTAELAVVRGESPPDRRGGLRAVGDEDEIDPDEDEAPIRWSREDYTRLGVAARPESPAVTDHDPEPAPVRIGLPGRHASRRAAEAGEWRRVVADPLRGRVALGSAQLAVVAVLAAIGLLVTGWWLLRSQSHEVAAPVAVRTPRHALATPDAAGSPALAAPASASAGAPSRVVVDVSGRVRRPGIAVLHDGARVIDALRAAGGARPGVDLGGLNLAQVLTDGEQIVVGAPATSLAGIPSAGATSAATTATLVDINTADETALESLPEVGPVTAQAILTYRTEHGGFSSVSQLLDVDGIGDATLAKLTPYVTV